MLCLVGVNDSGRNGMKNELSYGQFLRNFIPSSIPFLTSCARYHTFNLRWNAPFSPILNFFSNLIIAILHFLKFFSKLSSYLYQFQVFLLIPFHSILPNQTQHKGLKKRDNHTDRMSQNFRHPCPAVTITLALPGSLQISAIYTVSILHEMKEMTRECKYFD